MDFEFLTAGRIIFGFGAFTRLNEICPSLGTRPLVVIGARHAQSSGLLKKLSPASIFSCGHEPNIEDVAQAVSSAKNAECDFIIAIGGGSVLDCAKATSALLTNDGPIKDYLEGVGTGRQLKNPSAPLIAIPTTAGTGSETTKNAVISGPGFKKSIRHDWLLPKVALVDPELTLSLSPEETAAGGMDALTQLLEPFVGRQAQPLTDALAKEGFTHVGRGLREAFANPSNIEARTSMSLASLLSGITLANAGVAAVHGLASVLGARFPIPHGMVCATLLPSVMRETIEAAAGTLEEKNLYQRFAVFSECLCGDQIHTNEQKISRALDELDSLKAELHISPLRHWGVTSDDLPSIAKQAIGASMRNHPVNFSEAQLVKILAAAL